MDADHTQTVWRMALWAWVVQGDGLSADQATWLSKRLAARTPLTTGEQARLRGPLLAWATQVGGAAFRGTIERGIGV